MIRLTPTDRKPNFNGVTPAFVAGGTLFVVAVLATFSVNHHYQTEFTPCLFKIVTHQPCFLCGGTRASINLLTGHPVTAFFFNPLVTVLLCYSGFLLILKFGFGKKIDWRGPFRNRHFVCSFAVALVLINWIYVLRTL